jgi:hypothetical protein
MDNDRDGAQHALTGLLDRLEATIGDDSATIGDIADAMGRQGLAALILVFSLISTSPASAIPGVTTFVAAVVLLLLGQMLVGRHCAWLPGFVGNRKLDTDKLRTGIDWLRKPVEFVQRFVRPRLTFLVHRPWVIVPMLLIACLCLTMPFLEVIPTSGSIASAIIALFAAGLLTRDGALVAAATALLVALPLLFRAIAGG